MQSVLIPWLSAARQTKAGGLCLKRKIRIHDSEDEDAVEFEYQQRGPLHMHLPPNHPAADSAVISMPPELLSDSDNSDDEEEDDSQLGLKSHVEANACIVVADAPLALLDGQIEQNDSDAVAVDLINPLNLWKALPKKPCQYVDVMAVHASDDDCANSFYDSDESALTPGFISDNDEGVPEQDEDWVGELMPITTRALRHAKIGTVIKRA